MDVRNKSGATGVCYEVKAKKYRAYINVNGEQLKLGYFTNFNDAVKARQDAEGFYKGYKADFSKGDYYTLSRFVLKMIRMKHPQSDLQFSTCTSCLVRSALSYDSNIPFPIYYFRAVQGLLDGEGRLKMSENEQKEYEQTKFNMFMLDDEDKAILGKWITGYSIRRIAKEHLMSVASVKRRLDVTKRKGLYLGSNE